MHATRNGIGVIMDWVPAHFPKDLSGLARFDGTALYEHQDSRIGEHIEWGTYIFNYGRKEVSNFLIANAISWLRGISHRRFKGRRSCIHAVIWTTAVRTDSGCLTNMAEERILKRLNF